MRNRVPPHALGMVRVALAACALCIGFVLASRAPADAALHVCNATLRPATVAIAVLEPNATGTQSESEGWFQIDANTCTVVIDSDLTPGARYYLFAKSHALVWAGNPATGTKDTEFCTNASARFFYRDRTAPLCVGEGEQMTWFINETVHPPDWTINLYSP